MLRHPKLEQAKKMIEWEQYGDAIALLKTLPTSPDRDRLLKIAEKKRFLKDGTEPTTLPSPNTAGIKTDEHVAVERGQSVAEKRPAKKRAEFVAHADEDVIPPYRLLRFVGFSLIGIGMAVGIVGTIFNVFLIFADDSYYRSGYFADAILAFISGVSLMVSGSTMLAFVDMARNTWRMSYLLARLVDKEDVA